MIVDGKKFKLEATHHNDSPVSGKYTDYFLTGPRGGECILRVWANPKFRTEMLKLSGITSTRWVRVSKWELC